LIGNNTKKTGIIKEWLNVSNKQNIEKMMSLLTEDVKIKSTIFGNCKGKSEVLNFWQKMYYAFPDLRMELITLAINDEHAMAEISIHGTHKRNFENKLHLVINFQ
jgi:steroid delta-isomerase-like uncharacterized protein